jgi:hypothetical protein
LKLPGWLPINPNKPKKAAAIAAIEIPHMLKNKKNSLRRSRKSLPQDAAIASLRTSKRDNLTGVIRVVATTVKEMTADMTMMKETAVADEAEDVAGVVEGTGDVRARRTMRGGSGAATKTAPSKRETISSTAPKPFKTTLRNSLGAATGTTTEATTINPANTTTATTITGSTITAREAGRTTTTTKTEVTTATRIPIITITGRAIGTTEEIMRGVIRPKGTAMMTGAMATTIANTTDSPTLLRNHM